MSHTEEYTVNEIKLSTAKKIILGVDWLAGPDDPVDEIILRKGLLVGGQNFSGVESPVDGTAVVRLDDPDFLNAQQTIVVGTVVNYESRVSPLGGEDIFMFSWATTT